MEFVTVFVASSQGEAAIVKGALEAADIPCAVEGADVQNLIGLGAFGTGFNPLTGSIKIKVAKEMEQEAREILKGNLDK